MRCTVTGAAYTVFGYGGKQVRDNIHSADLVAAFEAFHARSAPGGRLQHRRWRHSNCSMLEAIELCERIAGRELDWRLAEQARIGDHRWWISDVAEFARDYPGWAPTRDTSEILEEMLAENGERWEAQR